MEKQALENILDTMPPGPWHARGNTVFAGSEPICVVFARQASFVANQLAKTPERLRALFDPEDDGAASHIATLEDKVETLEEERDDLKSELEDARLEVKSLRADLAEAQKELDDRLAGK